MAEVRPKLEVVQGGCVSPNPEGAGPPAQVRSGRAWAPWVLLALLLLALVGLGVEARQADQLEARIAGLEGELRAAELDLVAHQSHLESVRASVAQLTELVNQDPGREPGN